MQTDPPAESPPPPPPAAEERDGSVADAPLTVADASTRVVALSELYATRLVRARSLHAAHAPLYAHALPQQPQPPAAISFHHPNNHHDYLPHRHRHPHQTITKHQPIACQMQSLTPLVLKTTHGWGESGVARLFQACPLS